MSTTKTQTASSPLQSVAKPPFPRPSQANGNGTILPSNPLNRPNGTLPNTPLAVSLISVILGSLVVAPVVCLAVPYLQSIGLGGWAWARPQLAIYFASVGIFHLLEFWTTAACNPAKVSVDSFLINNGMGYHAAHLAGLIEYLATNYFYSKKYDGLVGSLAFIVPVLILLVLAQTFRSLAMIHASASFSHVVKAIKHDDHVLITSGVYSWARHPSYVGFFWWAIATQLLLGNIASPIMFAAVLGKFFYHRIISEERHLVRFFGDDYVQYRKRVGTGLPFPVPTK